MSSYNPQEIEKKWQQIWAESKLYEARDFDEREKFYCLDMFPYPSGEGLHVGHWRGYVLSDLISRYQMLHNKNVLHPMGWDAFGLPAENAAIKFKSHPEVFTQNAIKKFTEQLKQIGTTIDWSREINTSVPEYYRWTQWLFLKLYEAGLSYRKNAPVNWCPGCQTVLANEQIVSGECERCGTKVVKKDLTQWFFKITALADSLLKDLDELDWPERTKTLQRNWIGKSVGAKIKFQVLSLMPKGKIEIEVFTTRADTLFGATYVVLAPEHELIKKLTIRAQNITEIEQYLESVQNKSDIERLATDKEKTGVEVKGIKAVNPVNDQQIPIFIADYVLTNYGTGAVMAVPAHDDRDYAFAKKFNLPIKEVIIPERIDKRNPPIAGKEKVERTNVQAIVYDPKTDKYLCLHSKKHSWNTFPMGGVNEGEDIIEAAKREVAEETGYIDLAKAKIIGGPVKAEYFANHKDQNRISLTSLVYFELSSDKKVDISESERGVNEILWITKKDLNTDFMVHAEMDVWLERLNNPDIAYTDYGILINSQEFDGLTSQEASKRIVEKLAKDQLAEFSTHYRLRDWLISRQRYWGAPIPIIYCDKCGEVPVPEKDLPVILPKDVEFKPHGESPLKQSQSFLKTTCPKCGGPGTRETDTMDTFVDSSWYYLRYTDSKNKDALAQDKKINYWMNVDCYIGGVEHAILHLLYARFISKALHRLNIVDYDKHGEPFRKLFNIGMIYLHGSKMSKSKGNIVSPDDLISKYGTDALRGYELFIGPADMDSEWQIGGISGIYRFCQKIWSYYKHNFSDTYQVDATIESKIARVTQEIEAFRPNTALSQLMELFNYLKTKQELSANYADKINILFAPIFPHLAEEVWSWRNHKDSVFNETWPKAEKVVIDQEIKIPVQVNGKLRDVIVVEPNSTQEQIESLARKSPKVFVFLEGKNVKKVIYLARQLINFVVE